MVTMVTRKLDFSTQPEAPVADRTQVVVLGTGSFLPPFVVDNDKITSIYSSKSPAWIFERTGIQARRHGFDYESRVMRAGFYDDDLAEGAARQALDKAGITAGDLDLIVRITCTPEHLFFPDPACILLERLGASQDCAAFTVPAGCGGLVYAMKMVESIIQGHGAERVLVVASNTPSSFVDFEFTRRDWLNAYVFGDGAGALVLGHSGEKTAGKGIIASYWGADRHRDPMMYIAGGSRNPTSRLNIADHWYKMDAKSVRIEAPKLMLRAIGGLQKKCPFSLEDVDWFLFHQANLRILEDLSKMAEITMEKVLVNVDKYANTSAASIAILLDEGVRSGKIRKGDLLLLAAVGAGWQYGSLLIRW